MATRKPRSPYETQWVREQTAALRREVDKLKGEVETLTHSLGQALIERDNLLAYLHGIARQTSAMVEVYHDRHKAKS